MRVRSALGASVAGALLVLSASPSSGAAAAEPTPEPEARTAAVVVARADGTLVPVGGAVLAGTPVRFVVHGFPAGARVGFHLGAAPVAEELVTGPDGTGSAPVVVPADLPGRVYLVVAAGGLRSAVHKITVIGRPAATPSPAVAGSVIVTVPGPSATPTPTPTPTRPSTPTPTPTPTVSPTGDGAGDLPTTGEDPTSSDGTLPRTGADPLLLVLAAVLAVLVGALLVGTGRARPLPGRSTSLPDEPPDLPRTSPHASDGPGARAERNDRALTSLPPATRGHAAVVSPRPVPSRAEQRRLAEERARAQRAAHALWRAWWLYPLLAGIVLATYAGVQSAASGSVREPVVVQTISTAP